jgi:hypothetical protein
LIASNAFPAPAAGSVFSLTAVACSVFDLVALSAQKNAFCYFGIKNFYLVTPSFGDCKFLLRWIDMVHFQVYRRSTLFTTAT